MRLYQVKIYCVKRLSHHALRIFTFVHSMSTLTHILKKMVLRESLYRHSITLITFDGRPSPVMDVFFTWEISFPYIYIDQLLQPHLRLLKKKHTFTFEQKQPINFEPKLTSDCLQNPLHDWPNCQNIKVMIRTIEVWTSSPIKISYWLLTVLTQCRLWACLFLMFTETRDQSR